MGFWKLLDLSMYVLFKTIWFFDSCSIHLCSGFFICFVRLLIEFCRGCKTNCKLFLMFGIRWLVSELNRTLMHICILQVWSLLRDCVELLLRHRQLSQDRILNIFIFASIFAITFWKVCILAKTTSLTPSLTPSVWSRPRRKHFKLVCKYLWSWIHFIDITCN